MQIQLVTIFTLNSSKQPIQKISKPIDYEKTKYRNKLNAEPPISIRLRKNFPFEAIKCKEGSAQNHSGN